MHTAWAVGAVLHFSKGLPGFAGRGRAPIPSLSRLGSPEPGSLKPLHGGSCDPWTLAAAVLFSQQWSRGGRGIAGIDFQPQGVVGGGVGTVWHQGRDRLVRAPGSGGRGSR